MFCKNCGKEITPDTKFCSNCGYSQTEEQPSVQTSTQAPVQNAYAQLAQTEAKAKKGMKIGAIVLLALVAVVVIAYILEAVPGLNNHTDGSKVISLIKQYGLYALMGGVIAYIAVPYIMKNQNS